MSMCLDDPDLPDVGGGCCVGADVYGPGRCTCWVTVHDLEQADPVPGPAEIRAGMCSDCAYRPGSPEKVVDPAVSGNPDVLEALAESGTPFYCHDGIRRVITRRHPAGAALPGHPAAYDPPVRDGIPYRADGRPGLLCAGWDARRRALAGRERHTGADEPAAAAAVDSAP